MKPYELAISRLKIMDLSGYPHDKIIQEIKNFGPIGVFRICNEELSMDFKDTHKFIFTGFGRWFTI